MFNQIQTLEWLIEDANENVRYLTAKNILNMPQCSLKRLKHNIKSDITYIDAIANQNEDGSLGSGNVWDGTPAILLKLVQRGFDISDPNIHKSCRHILEYQDKNYRWAAMLNQDLSEYHHCYAVDSFFLKTLLLAGFPPLDIRVRKSFAKVIKQQSKDGGWGKGCKKFEKGMSCPFKTLQVIHALSLVQLPQYEHKLEQGVKFLNSYLKIKSQQQINELLLKRLDILEFLKIAVDILPKEDLNWAKKWALTYYNGTYFQLPKFLKENCLTYGDYFSDKMSKEFFSYHLTYFMFKLNTSS
ncbi:hypothetical protein PRVXT_001967 [Proteinivorax tanatarense]|uniref:Squalene cyclase C-terminal domain-containing protein n=1 Tax=Proteinivorax tanatarense TaxID=1260629 RepID=A0AAU7VIT5_9FIRM